MKQKKGLTFSSFLITLLVISALTAGIFLVMTEQSNTYDVDWSDSGLGQTFNKTQKILNSTEDIKSDVFGASVESGTAENSLFQASFKTLKTIGLSFTVFSSMINDMFIAIPVAPAYKNVIVSVLLIGVLITLLLLILGYVLRIGRPL